MNAPFVIERVFNAKPEMVWRAITERDLMKRWYFDLKEFRPEVGFRFHFSGQGHKGEQYMHNCEITEVIPNKKLKHSWAYDGYEGMSYVTFELFPEGEKTRLRLTHEGLDSFPKDNPDFAQTSFEAGWTEIIGKNLKAFVEDTMK
ncbi:MAG: hypothetical protein K0S33_2897 [Bacteroidetes bacterium]|jgi:uncharacterized protein YndB with AHSA1/START domain|nr:hypothetical protein [Bacteroidota bacterium]